jgi:hypothetical protein
MVPLGNFANTYDISFNQALKGCLPCGRLLSERAVTLASRYQGQNSAGVKLPRGARIEYVEALPEVQRFRLSNEVATFIVILSANVAGYVAAALPTGPHPHTATSAIVPRPISSAPQRRYVYRLPPIGPCKTALCNPNA